MKTCLACGEDISKKKNSKYCSNKCQHIFEWVIFKSKIENETATQNSVLYKKYLKETRGHKCEICEIFEWCGEQVPLVLDHISGNSEDWSLKNLRLICPNCDHQTPTFSGRNKGNGRIKRTQKRHEDKRRV